MRIFMMTDLEGVAGNTTFTTDTYPDGKYYEAAKRRLTAEINAAVAGLVEAGATDVLVFDAHGPGGVDYDTLLPPARLLHGRPVPPRRVMDETYSTCEAAVIIGQHAMAGVRDGDMNHTQSSQQIDRYTLNGKQIGEIAQFALYQGAFGIPLIFVSGDEAACAEARELIPGVHTAAVKQGLGRNFAISLAPAEAHRLLREEAANALRAHLQTPVQPLVWDPPYVLEKRYFHTDIADQAEQASPGAIRVDSQTVRLESDDIRFITYA